MFNDRVTQRQFDRVVIPALSNLLDTGLHRYGGFFGGLSPPVHYGSILTNLNPTPLHFSSGAIQ